MGNGKGRGPTGEEEHLAFLDRDILEGVVFDDSEKHGAFDLVEPFLGQCVSRDIPSWIER